MKILMTILIFISLSSALGQTRLENKVLRKSHRLSRMLNRDIGLLNKQELLQLSHLLDKSIQVVQGIPTQTWTCSFGWMWNGPRSSDLGSSTLKGTGDSKQKAFENLISNCIDSDTYLTTVRYCKKEIKLHKAYCVAQ